MGYSSGCRCRSLSQRAADRNEWLILTSAFPALPGRYKSIPTLWAQACRAVLSRFVLELRVTRSPAFPKVTSQAARSIGLSMVLVASVCQPSTLRMLIWPEASKAQNNMAAVAADGSTVWVFIRRLNSSCRRSIAFVVLALRHWLGERRVKVKRRSPASSRLSATGLHLSRHLRRKALRRAAISVGVAA